jgi:hypothetical protein
MDHSHGASESTSSGGVEYIDKNGGGPSVRLQKRQFEKGKQFWGFNHRDESLLTELDIQAASQAFVHYSNYVSR